MMALPLDATYSEDSFGAKGYRCGMRAYNIITGYFDHGAFNSCMYREVGISKGCSECYAVAGTYGSNNCKLACWRGWCEESCLSCTDDAQTAAARCSGRPKPQVSPCVRRWARLLSVRNATEEPVSLV